MAGTRPFPVMVEVTIPDAIMIETSNCWSTPTGPWRAFVAEVEMSIRQVYWERFGVTILEFIRADYDWPVGARIEFTTTAEAVRFRLRHP